MKDIIDWVLRVISTYPEDWFKNLINIIFLSILVFFRNKIFENIKNIKLFKNKFFSFIGRFLCKTKKSSLSYRKDGSKYIDLMSSPNYNYKFSAPDSFAKRNSSLSQDDILSILVIGIFLVYSLIGFYKAHKDTIFQVLNIFGILSIVVIFILAVSIAWARRGHWVTIKFIVFNSFSTFYINYYAQQIDRVADSLSPEISLINFGSSAYKIIGFLIILIQMIFIFIFLVRVIFVYADSKLENVPNFIAKLIFRTRHYDSIPKLITSFLVFSLLSYFLTTGILYEWVANMNKVSESWFQ